MLGRDTGTPPSFEDFDGDEAAARTFVIAANLTRRHFDASQRAMIAARLATLPAHRPGKYANLHASALTVGQAAGLMNVSERSVASARSLLRQGDSETVASVDRGELSLSKASRSGRRLVQIVEEEDTPIVVQMSCKVGRTTQFVVPRMSEVGPATQFVVPRHFQVGQLVRLTHDPRTDVAHIHLAIGHVAQSIEVSSGILHELDEAGRLLGIKIHNAKEKLPPGVLSGN